MAGQAGGSVNVSIGATFASTFRATFLSAEKELGTLGNSVRALDDKISRINGFRSMQEKTASAEQAWQKADKELQELSASMSRLGVVTERQAAKLKTAEARALKLKDAFERSQTATDQMGRELRDAGIDTNNLTAAQQKLERQIQSSTNRMTAMSKIAGAGLGETFSKVTSQMRSLATQSLIAGAGIGYFFKTNFVDVASQFEKFRTILETTEGSSAGAQKSMDWISDFAAKTPYELAEITDAFVKLRAYGLDPTNGLLKTLGDTGAAMGKPIMQAVEAIADAVAGENERLKEFGIRASKKGSSITYNYTDKAGKQRVKKVDANNRKMIESTLAAIWNEKYGGAMDKLSGTWDGMVSNLKDQWSRFANNTMNAGLFDWMKNRLGGLLETLNTMAANGQLQAWAETTGSKLVEFAQGAWELGSAIAGITVQIKDFVGGWENMAYLLVGLKLAPMIVSFGQLAWSLGTTFSAVMQLVTGATSLLGAFKVVGAFLLANPIGIAIAALGTAAYLLWKNWDDVKGGLLILWQQISEAGVAAFDWLKSRVSAVIDWLAEKVKWLTETVKFVHWASTRVGEGIGNAAGKAASWFSSDSPSTSGPSAGPATAAPVAPVSAVPSGGGSITLTSRVNAPITINGATDPAATAKAVDEALRKREREAKAQMRSTMTDNLGY